MELLTVILEDVMQSMDCLPEVFFGGLSFWLFCCLGQWIGRKRRRLDPGKMLVQFCLIIYVAVVLDIVFFSREPGSRVGVSLQFFETWGNTVKSRGYVIENILLFIPFGILLPLVSPCFRKAWLCVPAGFLCSLGIELAQFVTERGFCQVDDVVMNVLGTAVGWMVYTVCYNICKWVWRILK